MSIGTPLSSNAITCDKGPFHAAKCRADLPDGVVLLCRNIHRRSLFLRFILSNSILSSHTVGDKNAEIKA